MSQKSTATESSSTSKEEKIDFLKWHTVNGAFTVKFNNKEDAFDFLRTFEKFLEEQEDGEAKVASFRADFSDHMSYIARLAPIVIVDK